MRKLKALYRALPMKVRRTLIVSDGWLVGSSVGSILDGKPVNDFDIIVPFENWESTMMFLADQKYELNTFAGFKFTLPDDNGGTVEVDVWPQDTDRYMKVASSCPYLFNLRRQKLFKNDE